MAAPPRGHVVTCVLPVVVGALLCLSAPCCYTWMLTSVLGLLTLIGRENKDIKEMNFWPLY